MAGIEVINERIFPLTITFSHAKKLAVVVIDMVNVNTNTQASKHQPSKQPAKHHKTNHTHETRNQELCAMHHTPTHQETTAWTTETHHKRNHATCLQSHRARWGMSSLGVLQPRQGQGFELLLICVCAWCAWRAWCASCLRLQMIPILVLM